MKLFKSLYKLLAIAAVSFFVLALKSGGASAATFNVASGTDSIVSDSSCSLSEAMTNIANQDLTYSDCAAGAGDDTIMLPVGTITLTADLPTVSTPLKVIGQGKGQSIIDGANNSKLFLVALGTVNSTINIEYRDFTAKNISRSTSAVCLSAGSSSSSTGSQTLTVANVDIENCGQNGITAGMFSGTTTISGVNLSSDLSTSTIGIFTLLQQQVSITNTSVAGYTYGLYLASNGPINSGTGSYSISNTTLTGNTIGLMFVVTSNTAELAVTAELSNNTIANNSNSEGGFVGSLATSGILFGVGADDTLSVNMKNNIVADNLHNGSLKNCNAGTAEFSILVTVTSTNNLSDDTCAGKLGGSDFTNVSGVASGLDVLADNGGGVKTMALLIGSGAIDQGATIGSITTDARGIARPQNGVYDIGAYEKTAQSTPDPDPDPEDPNSPGPPGATPNDPGTPSVPRTGKLIGAFLASTSLIALLVLASKEVIDGRIKLSKSGK